MSKSESAVQNDVRVAYAQRGYQLFRNNVGVLKNSDGVPVRFGLGNDTKASNAMFKSGDLIGWETVTITPEMVGQRIARFVSIENKPEGWKPVRIGAKGDRWQHEEAQRRWAAMVIEAGGTAKIITGVE